MHAAVDAGVTFPVSAWTGAFRRSSGTDKEERTVHDDIVSARAQCWWLYAYPGITTLRRATRSKRERPPISPSILRSTV